ncbi:MAG: DNA repair protein RecO [Candidatus Brocadia sp. AMX2]|uniref:DNA repair protein RecO n=1 Tax=Candidatus Brocadia sinica JPN1 TaxID=1197129 RepID=A0ABQ0JZG4_9BACT|nr:MULTISPECIES: DNA repair protein RecO [Brocadia]MBC6932346.1 DNA repair protein RecO [Candidatus Brocadia sp.]MBL1169838.1 DNA repair protein RecO [Candidatus Brocadia sp. AMX1]MCK6469342.1 DNA repair protein RecO [Candidatus Brocadia sinica]KAA0243754.1 MAG: DNA repair protein RecO [Candidatus Brocadia sp. AMX2]MCE7866735.1 DNA repair protein RecO [Candidatus Brocadia sp. AMX2]
MSIFRTEAVALGRTDYSDSSQIITFYTRDYGKIHTLAKGFKRTSGRYSSKAVDLLTYYQILFIKKTHTSLHTLTEAVLQDNYPMLRTDLDRYYMASCAAELVNEFTGENDPSEQLFDVFVNTLTGIARDTDAMISLLAFEIKMLKILGYLPEWGCCVNCKNSIPQISGVYFNAREGGILCRRCQVKFKNGIVVPAGAISIAGRFVDINLQRLERVRIQSSICVEIEKMLRYYINSLLNKGLNSWKYIKI